MSLFQTHMKEGKLQSETKTAYVQFRCSHLSLKHYVKPATRGLPYRLLCNVNTVVCVPNAMDVNMKGLSTIIITRFKRRHGVLAGCAMGPQSCPTQTPPGYTNMWPLSSSTACAGTLTVLSMQSA